PATARLVSFGYIFAALEAEEDSANKGHQGRFARFIRAFDKVESRRKLPLRVLPGAKAVDLQFLDLHAVLSPSLAARSICKSHSSTSRSQPSQSDGSGAVRWRRAMWWP